MERKGLQKFKNLENEKSFSDELKTKTIFYSFWRAIICWRNNSGHKRTQALKVYFQVWNKFWQMKAL